MTTLALPPKYARTQQLRGLPSFADKSRLTTLDINQVPAPPACGPYNLSLRPEKYTRS